LIHDDLVPVQEELERKIETFKIELEKHKIFQIRRDCKAQVRDANAKAEQAKAMKTMGESEELVKKKDQRERSRGSGTTPTNTLRKDKDLNSSQTKDSLNNSNSPSTANKEKDTLKPLKDSNSEKDSGNKETIKKSNTSSSSSSSPIDPRVTASASGSATNITVTINKGSSEKIPKQLEKIGEDKKSPSAKRVSIDKDDKKPATTTNNDNNNNNNNNTSNPEPTSSRGRGTKTGDTPTSPKRTSASPSVRNSEVNKTKQKEKDTNNDNDKEKDTNVQKKPAFRKNSAGPLPSDEARVKSSPSSSRKSSVNANVGNKTPKATDSPTSIKPSTTKTQLKPPEDENKGSATSVETPGSKSPRDKIVAFHTTVLQVSGEIMSDINSLALKILSAATAEVAGSCISYIKNIKAELEKVKTIAKIKNYPPVLVPPPGPNEDKLSYVVDVLSREIENIRKQLTDIKENISSVEDPQDLFTVGQTIKIVKQELVSAIKA